MINYVIRRLLQTLLVIVCLSFVSFSMMGLMPGDPLDLACQANPYCTPDNLEEMKRLQGLDRPIHERYLNWAGSILTGDLGYSRIYRIPVQDVLWPRLINTLVLSGCALVFSLLIAIPLGVLTSLKPRSKFDYSVNFLAFTGISAPSFWLGLMLIIIFAVNLGWFPAGGVQTIGDASINESTWAMIKDRAWYLVLPVAALSAQTIAQWVRYTRASMLEVRNLDYIRTAHAKGVHPRRVIVRHALRNALIPVVTVIAVSFSVIFSGTLITEMVFAYQGVGKLIYDSVMGNDFNMAMIAFLIISASVLVMNLIADLCYAYLDPRITYQ